MHTTSDIFFFYCIAPTVGLKFFGGGGGDVKETNETDPRFINKEVYWETYNVNMQVT